MKIKVNRRYVTKGSMSSSPKMAFIVRDLGTQKYYAVEGQGQIYSCNEFGINQQGEDKFNLVAPYKPKKREPKVGDEIIYKVRGKIVSIPQSRVGVNVLHKTHAPLWEPQEVEVRLDTRDIVRYLNKEKV